MGAERDRAAGFGRLDVIAADLQDRLISRVTVGPDVRRPCPEAPVMTPPRTVQPATASGPAARRRRPRVTGLKRTLVPPEDDRRVTVA